MSNRFHNKFHRQNHHSKVTDKNQDYTDASYDPIASFDAPFQGEFYGNGDIITTENLSALSSVYANDGVIKNNFYIGNDLEVVGNFVVLGSTSRFETTVYASSAVEIVNVGTGPALKITQHGSQPIAHFIDYNGEDIIFQDNGYVGLGTDSPNEKLTIVGNTSAVGDINVTGNSYLSGNLYIDNNLFVTETTNLSGNTRIQGHLAVDTDVLYVDVWTNKVGVNTNTPNVDLTVSGSISATRDLYIDRNSILGSLSAENNTTINGGLVINSNLSSASVAVTQEGSGDCFVVQNTAVFPFVITSSGTVGIGTQVPDNELTVIGSISATKNLHVTDNAYLSASTYIKNDLLVNENVFYVDSTNNKVGVNTDKPNVDLTISGTVSATADLIVNGNTYLSGNQIVDLDLNVNSNIYLSGDQVIKGNLLVDDVDTTLFVDSANNKVGIGTLVPNTQLTIAGSTSASTVVFAGSAVVINDEITLYKSDTNTLKTDNELSIGTIQAGATNDVITKDSDNVLTVRTINSRVWDTNANFLSGTLTNNLVPKYDSGNTLVNSIIYDDGTRVGINTVSPTTTFAVAGSSHFYGDVTVYGNLTATGNAYFANTIFSTTSALSVVHTGSGPAAWIGNVGTGDIASFYDIDAGVEILHIGGYNSEYPNIGINISNPTTTLHISATDAVIIPAGNTSQRPNSGKAKVGALRFNTDQQTFEGYYGSVWSSLGTTTAAVTSDVEVGAISATQIIQPNTTLQEFVEKLLTKIYYPTFTNPSASLSVVGTSSIVEAGTNNLSFAVNFNRGSINGNTISGVWFPNVSQNSRSGTATKYTFFGVDNGTTSSYTSATSVIQDGTNTFSATVDYGTGPQPVNSKFVNFNSPYPAGSLTPSATITGRRRLFYGADSSSAIPTTSSQVRSLPQSFLNPVIGNQLTKANSLALNIPIGAARVIIAIPTSISSSIASVTYFEAGGTLVRDTFTERTPVQVAGLNSYATAAYRIFAYIPSVPFTSTATYEITI